MEISKRYWNSNATAMTAYTPGFQPPPDAALIKLNTNENPFPPSPKVIEAVRQLPVDYYRLYPPALWDTLRMSISTAYGVPEDCVFCGNGSDEILSLIFRTFTDPGDRLLLVDPTYSLYPVLASASGVQTDKLPLSQDFTIDFAALPVNGYKLICLPNPNAPTGMLAQRAQLENFISRFQGLVVIDEAYIDFSDDPEQSSCVPLISKYNNLIVLRTFSKSFSLCGLRAGYAFACNSLIAGLMTVKDSYNMNIVTQIAAAAAVSDMEYMKKNSRIIAEIREQSRRHLEELGFQVEPSQANFLLISHPKLKMAELHRFLVNRKIHLRYFPELPEYLRLTIGTREQMDKFFLNLVDALD